MAEITIRKKAPNFSLKDQFGKTHKLSDYRGKKVILYFYPKDNTPGCTIEACNFKDNISQFKKKDAIVLGVSVDDEKSHKKFSEKFSLPFPILSDVDKKIVSAYKVWGEKSFMGRKYMGTNRETFIIDEKGKILKHFDKVNIMNHSKDILKLL